MTRPHEQSRTLFERARSIFPGGVNSPVRSFASVGGEPFIVDRGEGAYLVDVDDNRYVDYVLSWGPLVLGHADPSVVSAIVEQASRGTSFGACCKLEADLAEVIQAAVPSLEMLRFVNSGTEAGMAVLRLARGFTGRSKVLKFAGCYHGHVDHMLVQAGSGVITLGIPGSAGVPERVTQDTLTVEFNDVDAVEEVFKRYGQELAAVILEPFVGNAGFLRPLPEFISILRKLTEQHGALLIFDEVMTGFRVGLGGAQRILGVTPDLTMLGKVIGGGLPVGAFGGRKEIMSKLAPLGPVYQAGTLSGNPLAMAAGLATVSKWNEGVRFEAASSAARTFMQHLRECAFRAGIPFTADSEGSMFGFFFAEGPIRSYSDAKRCDTELFKRFFNLMLDEGVYLAPSAFEAGFTSSLHTGEPLSRTIEAATAVFSRLTATA